MPTISKNQLLFVLLLIGIGFAVYAFNLQNPLFWDDDDWIKGNIFVHDFSHLKEIFTRDILAGFGLQSNYYRPILLLSFAFNWVLHGVAPIGYHLVSSGFHIANGILIYLLLVGVFRKRLVAFFAALLFLIHPLQTEAVTYISGRGDPMSVFFMLLALWLFAKADCSTSQVEQSANLRSQQKRRGWWYLASSVLSMIAAILSRETAVLFPVLLMVFSISFIYCGNAKWTEHRNFALGFKKAIRVVVPFFVVSVVYAILRLTVLNFKNTLNFYVQANDYTEHLAYRLYTFGHALVEYFKLIFAPVGLHMERDLPLKTSVFQWPVPLAMLILAAIFLLTWIFCRKDKLSSHDPKFEARGTESETISNDQNQNVQNISNFRVWAFGWSWFFIALAPVSGIIPINAVMYEHWLYLPLIGFFTIIGFYIARLFDYFKMKKLAVGSWLLAVALAGYFSFFAVQSVGRNILWGKPIEFYEDILRHNPRTVRIMNNLGNLYSEKGELDKAAAMYERAISTPAGNIFAQPYYNLGNIYRDRGDTGKAIELYKKAIEADPTFSFAYQNLAVIYANRGDFKKAAEMLEQLKNLRPNEPRLYYNLALVYVANNKFELAIVNLKEAIKFSANDIETNQAARILLDKIVR